MAEKNKLNKKWTDELIEKGIRNVMAAWDIDYMPSKTETIKVLGNVSLDIAIQRSYGYSGWAVKLGLKNKSEVMTINDDEETVAKKKEIDQFVRVSKNQQIGKKATSDAETGLKMLDFSDICSKRNQSFNVQKIRTADELDAEIKQYIETVLKLGLHPTKSGLASWLNTTYEVLILMENSLDDRGKTIKKFMSFLLDYHNQIGLATEGNPAYNIFYGKAQLGMRETAELNINVNSNIMLNNLDMDEVSEKADFMPDVDYEIE